MEQQKYSTGEGDESVGQYDDLFDDIEENNGSLMVCLLKAMQQIMK